MRHEPDVIRARPSESAGAKAVPVPLSVIHDAGSVDEANDPGLEKSELLGLYRWMVFNRMLDERMIKAQRQGRIGFYIGSIGEEAAILGSAYVLRPQDWVFPCYREHGAALMRGLPLDRFVANLFGTVDDPVLGRQMPCHEAWRPGNFASISSPLGTQIPHAVGLAWGAKLRGEDVVSLVYFGEGATSTNDFHTGMNFAGVSRAPCLFLCRNNQWAISVPLAKQTAASSIAAKGEAYGMPGVRVDGNDLLAVIAATKAAHERARRGEGPTLIEAVTYRLEGHSTSDDPRAYREDEEVKVWRQRDPLLRMKAYLEAKGLWSPGEDDALRGEIDGELRRAVERAEKAPRPPLGSLTEGVYRDRPWHLAEQQAEAEAGAEGHANPGQG